MNKDEENRVSPLGLFRYGSEFLDAAEKVKDPSKPDHILDHSAPFHAYYLVGHSIELLLKSYLRSKRKTLKELKRIGHCLMKALQEAEILGLHSIIVLSDEQKAEVALLNETYFAKEFEYFRQGLKDLPYYARVFKIARTLEQGLSPIISVKLRDASQGSKSSVLVSNKEINQAIDAQREEQGLI